MKLCTLERNPVLVALYRFCGDFWLLVPVLIPYYVECGLSAFQIMLVQGVFSAVSILAEVPSGYLADRIGRVRGLMLAALLLPAGCAIYAFSGSFYWFILAEVILGAGFAFLSGTDVALLYDSMSQCGRGGEYQRVQGRVESAARAGAAGSAIAGGMLGAVALQLPFLANIGIGLLMFVLTFGMREPRTHHHTETHERLRDVVRNLGGQRKKVFPLVAIGALMFGTGISSIWCYMLVYEHAGYSPLLIGIVFSLSQIGSGVGAHFSHHLDTFRGGGWLPLLFLLPGLCLLVASFLPAYLVPLAAIAHLAVWGVSTPQILGRLNGLVSSRFRATIISMYNLVGRLVFIVFSLLTGLVVDHVSLSAGLQTLAVLFTVPSAIAVFLLLRHDGWVVPQSGPVTDQARGVVE